MTQLNEAKYRNIILYFIGNTDAAQLGKVKLMKLLYFLDFAYFERYRISMTGDDYQHQVMGPVPLAASAVIHRMQSDGQITAQKRAGQDAHPQTEYIPRQDPDLTVFSDAEREMLIIVARKWYWHTEREIVDAVHGDLPWQQTAPNAIIDYALAVEREREFILSMATEEIEDDLLTPEDQQLRDDGLALMAQFEEMSRTNPTFQQWIQKGLISLQSGNYRTTFLDI